MKKPRIHRWGLLIALAPFLAMGAVANAQQDTFWLYSTDLGSDLDLSDPVTPANNWMDCGDIYRPGAPGYPTLWKDDTGPTNWWTGWPFANAPQPAPGQVPTNPAAPEAEVLAAYADYFDLDAEDQVCLAITGPRTFDPSMRSWLSLQCGIYFRPPSVFASFEDDGAAGWYKSGDVPTTAAPDNITEIWVAPLFLPDPAPPPPAVQVTFGCVGQCPAIQESALDLGLDPLPRDYDDDVDALDLQPDWRADDPYDFRYWSPDHEANLDLDPGDIYLTANGGNQNYVLALDDVANFGLLDDPATPDILEDADIDAFEFILIDAEGFETLFEYNPGTSDDILLALFSIDEDDPDTPTIDESGGLLPYMIYASDLVGNYVEVEWDAELRDIDGITVIPEPVTLWLLGLGGLALLRRQRA